MEAKSNRRASRFSVALQSIAVIFAYLAVAEIVLRFLPVTTGLHSVAVDAAHPILHFEPDFEFVYSRGWNLRDVVRGRVNNAGWVNAQDYTREAGLPLIAVIGDSFIEAQMVPYAETLQGRLAAALKGKARVYSIAASGAPLSQFAVFAGYAVHELGAAVVIVNIANYDFALADAAYNRPAGMWVYDGTGDAKALTLIPYQPGWLREAARRSALARYLLLDLRLDRTLAAAHLIASLTPMPPANAAGADTRLAAAKAVIPLFLRDLARQTGLPPDKVAFTMDGVRYPYLAGTADPHTEALRRSFRDATQANGYETVELDPYFFARYRQDGVRLDIPNDGHWNAAGHEAAAEAVMGSRLIADLLAPPR
jgi:hypothetical protein